jgi:Protein of unknown function (DUF2752)
MPGQFVRFLILVLGVVLATLLYCFNPESVPYPPCFFRILTGLECPGCGSARSAYHLLHGNFGTAIDYNILFIAAVPFVAIEGLSRLFYRSENQVLKFRVFNYIKAWHVMLVVIIFWIIRNLPVYPLNLLSSNH